MAYPTPIESFLNLSVPIQVTIALFGLVAVQQLRQGHIGRVGIASAGVAVFVVAYPRWEMLPEIWRLYTVIGGVFAIIAGVSYLTKTSLPTEFYKTALLLFGGATVILVFLYGIPF